MRRWLPAPVPRWRRYCNRTSEWACRTAVRTAAPATRFAITALFNPLGLGARSGTAGLFAFACEATSVLTQAPGPAIWPIAAKCMRFAPAYARTPFSFHLSQYPIAVIAST